VTFLSKNIPGQKQTLLKPYLQYRQCAHFCDMAFIGWL